MSIDPEITRRRKIDARYDSWLADKMDWAVLHRYFHRGDEPPNPDCPVCALSNQYIKSMLEIGND